MNSEEIQLVKEILSGPRKIVIVPHKNPDGDAVGSVLALWHYLKSKGQHVNVISPNDFPRFLKWMPGTEEMLIFEKQQERSLELIGEAEYIFTLDFNDLSRVGDMQEALEQAAARFIMIDHHQEPQSYAYITYSDRYMSSTAEMVFNFIEFLGDKELITRDIATCLYTGILTDTGSFKFSATTGRTHRVIAELIDNGADNSTIHSLVFDTFTPDRLYLLGRALNNMVILPEYSTAYITLSSEDLKEFNFKKGDTEGIVNYGLSLEGICFAAIFIENAEDDFVKISLRSEGDFSVNDFARAHFDGGGHINAAGGRSDLSLKDTARKFESLLPQYKNQLKK